MEHLNDTEKYLEARVALELIVSGLRVAYNNNFFDPSQKKYIFNLLREGDTSLKKISE